MSDTDTQCKPGDTTGFPVTLAQSLYTNWPATANAQQQLQKLTVPTDFSLQWQNNGVQGNANISVNFPDEMPNGEPRIFQISGFSPDGSTITYGSASYNCSGVISIVQNQHPTFCQDRRALYEMILAFQITNKSTNPSSPDIILLCRPLVFETSGANTSFWAAVDNSCIQKKPQMASLDMSTFFGYNASLLMPMVTYQTCMPVKHFDGGTYKYRSLRLRVNVVPQPLYIVASEHGLGKCSAIQKYTLITTGNGPIGVFGYGNILQFRDGLGPDLYPVNASRNNFVPNAAPAVISAFADIIQKFEILVPEAFLGKSLAEIAKTETPPPVQSRKKAYKCYTIDPKKDIVGDQIMVDPTTGQSLQDTQKQEALEAAGGDPTLIGDMGGGSSGIMPGDIEHFLTLCTVVIGSIALLSYLGFIMHLIFYRQNGLHDSMYHIIGFVVSFIVLVLFSVYVEKPTE